MSTEDPVAQSTTPYIFHIASTRADVRVVRCTFGLSLLLRSVRLPITVRMLAAL